MVIQNSSLNALSTALSTAKTKKQVLYYVPHDVVITFQKMLISETTVKAERNSHNLRLNIPLTPPACDQCGLLPQNVFRRLVQAL